jgi:hypothetical protein
MSKKTIAAALAAAMAMGALSIPAAEAGHRHHKNWHFKHWYYTPYYFGHQEPTCGKWFYSRKYQKWVCKWWY